MIDADTFLRNSPFQATHGPNQSLDNTTPELLKFSLQEQHRNKLRELKDNHHDLPNLNLLHSQFLQDSFNNHLQKSLDEGTVLFDESGLSEFLPPSSVSSHSELNNVGKPNYLNLKVLIENSVFDTKNINKDSILSLTALKQLKLRILDKKELKQYLKSKHSISQEFMSSMILNPSTSDEIELDSTLLLKIIKLNHSLLQQLTEVSDELESLTTKLNNHNMACMVLGYVEDIKITSLSMTNLLQYQNNFHPTSTAASPLKDHTNNTILPPSTSGAISPSRSVFNNMQQHNKAFDTLFAHIASIAALRNIVLPSPPMDDDLASRTTWALGCIDAILASSPAANPMTKSTPETPNEKTLLTPITEYYLHESSLASTSSPVRSSGNGNDKQLLLDYKTALNDLRFSHQYLTKEFEYSRQQSFKIIQEFRKKNAILEKEINRVKENQTSTDSSTFSNPELLATKEREISKLRKELNALKIDQMGMKLTSTMSPPFNSSTLSLSPRHEQYDLDDDVRLQSSRMSPRPSSSGTSNGILRKEFKKIVGNIQDQYEVELEEERLRRRKLEEQLKQLQVN